MIKPEHTQRRNVIRSSDIAQYVYCPKCWWQVYNGNQVEMTSEIKQGQVFHHDFMLRQNVARNLNVIGKVVFTIIIMLIGYLVLKWLI